MPTSERTTGSLGSLVRGDQPLAYERWKLDDFSRSPKAGSRGSLPTVQQIEALREQARAEAHAAGKAEGYAEGARQAQAEAEHLRGMVNTLEESLREFDREVAEQLVTLALDMARQLVKDSLTRQPEQVVDVVRDAMQALPPFGEHAQLMLHPADVALVRHHMGEQLAHSKWKLMEDAAIERGGCRVQTASMQVDATLPSRWQRMAATLARNDAWHLNRAIEPSSAEDRS